MAGEADGSKGRTRGQLRVSLSAVERSWQSPHRSSPYASPDELKGRPVKNAGPSQRQRDRSNSNPDDSELFLKFGSGKLENGGITEKSGMTEKTTG